MTTLNDLMNLMPYATLDFGSDSFIQVVDYSTNAHYRTNEEGLTLGGNPIPCTAEELMKMPIKYIEYFGSQCIINI